MSLGMRATNAMAVGMVLLIVLSAQSATAAPAPHHWTGTVSQPKDCKFFKDMRYHAYPNHTAPGKVSLSDSLAAALGREKDTLCREVFQARPALQKCSSSSAADLLPSFMVIGTPKGGTTYISSLLRRHPQVWMKRTETHFWTKRPTMSLQQYKEFMTMKTSHPSKKPYILGDDSPTYLWMHSVRSQRSVTALTCLPPIPLQVRCCIPDVKMFVTLRDPTTRMASNFVWMNQGGPPAFTADVFHSFVERNLALYDSCCHHRPTIKSDVFAGNWLSCATCMERATFGNGYGRVWVGLYAYHLAYWFRFFPRKAFFITTVNDISEASKKAMEQDLLEHIGLSLTKSALKGVTNQNSHSRTFRMFKKTALMLHEFYRPFNEALADLLGESFPLEWNSKDTLLASPYVESGTRPATPRGSPNLRSSTSASSSSRGATSPRPRPSASTKRVRARAPRRPHSRRRPNPTYTRTRSRGGHRIPYTRSSNSHARS